MDGQLLLWNEERVEQERERVEQERERAEQERERAEQERGKASEAIAVSKRAVEKLIALELPIEEIAENLGLSVEAVRAMLQN